MGKSLRPKIDNGKVGQNRDNAEHNPDEPNISGNGATDSGNVRTGNGDIADRRSRARSIANEIKTPKAQETLSIETENLEIPELKTRKGRKASKKIKPNGKAAATGLIEMIELFAVARFGQVAAFTANERLLIEPSLARLIEKYGDVASSYGGLLDPILLLAGIGVYAIRMSAIVQQSSEQSQKPSNESGGNGKVNEPTSYIFGSALP